MTRILTVIVFSFAFAAVAFPASAQTVLPSGVLVLWESHSLVPPFYRGKAFHPQGGDLTLVAVPERRFGDPDALSYTWSVDGEILGTKSGVGRRTLLLAGSGVGREPFVAVEVRRPNANDILAAGGLAAPIATPRVLFYEASPTLGTLFNRAFASGGTLEISDTDEIALDGWPFFFSAGSRAALRYRWTANNQPVPEETTPALVLRREGEETQGRSDVALSVEHPTSVFERARVDLSVQF